MKLGICYNMYTERVTCYGDEKFRKLKEFGFDCVDFGLTDTKNPLYTLPIEEAKEILLKEKRLAEEAGISIWQTHGPWCWPPVKDETPEGRILRAEEMKRSILIASLLGSKYWVVHPIMPYRLRDLLEGNEAATWELNVEFMGWLVEYARELDVTICLENMPHRNFSMAKPEKVLQLIREINDPHFQMCLDTGHVATQEGLDLAQQVRMIGKHLKVMHVHDNNGEKDQHRWPGEGILNWESFADALRDIGFDGVFSLETNPAVGISEAQFRKEAQQLVRIGHDIVNRISR